MKRIILIIASVALFSLSASAQKISVNTNLIDYVNFGTPNIELGFSVAQHWSLHAGAKYNNWILFKNKPDQTVMNKKRTFSLGTRFWPWHVYSGWWIAADAQYQEYAYGGWFLGKNAEEGDAYGLALSAGYSHMIKRWLNIEFGIGLWGGWKEYTRYDCPVCGHRYKQGQALFIMPEELKVSLSFIF